MKTSVFKKKSINYFLILSKFQSTTEKKIANDYDNMYFISEKKHFVQSIKTKKKINKF